MNSYIHMIAHLPVYILWTFGLTTALTLFLFYKISCTRNGNPAFNFNTQVLILLILWLLLQAILPLNNFYSRDTNSFPPNILLFGIIPPIAMLVILFTTRNGKQFIDRLSLLQLTYIHSVRIPVEITLYWLFLYNTVPELMTYTGRNFDIIAGITAPLLGYFGLVRKKISNNLLLLWNIVGLGLLINIVVSAFLSTPSPIQKFAFDQPNIAILNFPFAWLPTFIVPLVLFAHLASIRHLLKKKKAL